MMRFDIEDTIASAHDWIGMVAYKFNRSGGFFDRMDGPINESVRLADDSVEVVRMFKDALTLRKLADALDERREALTGRAPRLHLIAAE